MIDPDGFIKKERFKNLFLGNTKVDFYKKSKVFYRVFIIEIILFIAIIIMAFSNILDLNLSVDFTGGTTYQFETEYSSEDISDVMNSNILEVSRYQTFENSNSIIFRATEASSDEEAQFLDYLSNKFNIPDAEIEFQRVGPTFGQEITQKGLRALIIFLSFIVILITYRYEFRYSLIALAALVHDLLLCFSIYLLLNLEITPSTVIALLTILGYSLYDTVISVSYTHLTLPTKRIV